MALITKQHCPLCGGSVIRRGYAVDSLQISVCACGFVYQWPLPEPADTEAMYSEDYYRAWGVESEDESLPRLMKCRTFSARIKRLEPFCAAGNILDVGCATGFFLDVAAAAGWQAYGVELSAYAARIAAKKHAGRIFQGRLHDAGFAAAMFDAICLSDLIEHIPEPLSFMAEVGRLLRPGGVLMIVTPDVSSVSQRVMGVKWSHYKAEHLTYFSPATMTRLLETSGFTPLLMEGAPKYLNLEYVARQFTAYPHPLLTPLTRLLAGLLPQWCRNINIPVYCGEMLVLAQKKL